MPAVLFTPKTFGMGPLPAAERHRVRFIPTGPGLTALTVFPGREVVHNMVEGQNSVELASTLNLRPEVAFKVQFEWEEHDPTEGWVRRGYSLLPGLLRVGTTDAYLGDLMDTPAPPGSVVYGYGPPSSSLQNVLYIDISGMKLVAYAPQYGGTS